MIMTHTIGLIILTACLQSNISFSTTGINEVNSDNYLSVRNSKDADIISTDQTNNTYKNWDSYVINNAFSISVPPSVELRKSNDIYTIQVNGVNWKGYKVNNKDVIFQQKGLSINSKKAYKTYCRIMINSLKGEDGDYTKSTDNIVLNSEDIRYFRNLVIQSIVGYKIVNKPQVRCIRVNNIYGIEIEYIRTGEENKNTKVFIYLFQNGNEMARLTISYRLEDCHLWENDFNKIIKTFKWIR